MNPVPQRRRLSLWGSVLLILWLNGCGGPRPGAGVAFLELSPRSATIHVDETQTFTVLAKDLDGNPVNGVDLSWASSSPEVATVAGGVATGVGAGETIITVSANDVTSNSATLNVTSAEQPSSFQLIDEALSEGEMDEETALTYKVFATFGDERLPAKFRGDDTGRDSTLLMTKLASTFDTLSPAAQATLQPFLLTPPEPGSWLEQQAASDSLEPQQIEWGTVVTLNDKVKVWYQTRYAGDDARAQKIADELDRIIWPKLTNLMRKPRPDCGAACPEGGGDERLDIYLVNINRAYTAGARAGGATYAYIVLGRTDSFATVAHEFMHAVQFAYPNASDDEYDWLFEATATWATDYVYPKSNMDPDFPATQEEQTEAFSFLNATETPLETTDDAHEYGAYLLPFYLAGYGREGAGAVRTMWENATQASSLVAVNAALSSRGGFAEVWPKFVLYNWNQEPVDEYQTWDELSDGASAATHFTVGSVGEDKLPADVKHLSALYYTLEFTSERIHSVIVENPFAEGGEPTANVQAIVKIGGQWRAPEDWTKLSRKKFCRDKPEEHVEELVLIVSNSEWQDRSRVLGAGNLKVKALEEGCTCEAIAEVKKWTASATFSYSAEASDETYAINHAVSADVSGTIEPTFGFGGMGSPSGTATIQETVHLAESGQFFSSIAGSGSPTDTPEDVSALFLSIDVPNCRYNVGVRVYVEATLTNDLGETAQGEAHLGGFGTAWRPIPDDLILSHSGSYPAHSYGYLEARNDLTDAFSNNFIDGMLQYILGEEGMGIATVTWSFSPLDPPDP